MRWKRLLPWLIPALPALAIKIFSQFPHAVEKYYSGGVYPFISVALRTVFGWLPFSAGDITYGFVTVWLLVRLVRFFLRLFRGGNRKRLPEGLLHLLSAFLWIYVVFNLLWGLNYDRPPIATRMNLVAAPYSDGELQSLLEVVCLRLNELDSPAHQQRPQLDAHNVLFRKSEEAYAVYAGQDESFRYRRPSVKSSLYGYLGNYLGFQGYYNPFSGEAQVNTTVPVFEQPFIACHEMAHQLGCAREEEANFAGFLAGKNSPDPAFRYAVYLDLYLYTGSELYGRDSTLFVPFREGLQAGVRSDLRELKAFSRRHRNPIEPVISSLYGSYLKANSQPQGINAYDEVVGLALAWLKKNGREAF